eukprot:CAMPEP_0180807552 /NCGR_PEP_ID=MMETSP1038_2-20121128/63305_1 /TAXON_ID=632150 /ORGANISM="Azadinium spinosum, Strain 3D9" /LENGTH=249 /DNA_ID=CAMNT_0022848569 /DNA_START=86 /DNA_END=832 /DNA_ORIENTATION=+
MACLMGRKAIFTALRSCVRCLTSNLIRVCSSSRASCLVERKEQDASGFARLMNRESAVCDHFDNIRNAPVSLRAPLLEALNLPDDARPEMIAAAMTQKKKYAALLAGEQLKQGREEIVRRAGLTSSHIGRSSEEEFRQSVYQGAEDYLDALWKRLIHPLESFTLPTSEWQSDWAEDIIDEDRYPLHLWGGQPFFAWKKHITGVTVLDTAVYAGLAAGCLEELHSLEAATGADAFTTSSNDCNIGARYRW